MDVDTEPLVMVERQFKPTVALLERNITFTRNCENLRIDVIFVVAFDTKKGNIIEWCHPSFMKEELEGLEFKSMPSGAHTQHDDFVYIYLPNKQLFGIACFEKLSVTYEGERGARMKSLGVLTRTNEYLHVHEQLLKPILSHMLLNPGEYSQAEEHQRKLSQDINLARNLIPQQVNCPDQWFEQTVNMIGPSLFVIWKAMMISKRILMYCPPPAFNLTKIVHCATFMKSCPNGRHNFSQCLPLYFVNVADSQVISSEISFIAYTTEKIFSEKKHMYDVYMDNKGVQICTSRFQKILGLTSGDKYRFSLLQRKMRSPVLVDKIVSSEDRFYSFFSELNSCMFRTLDRIANEDKKFVRLTDMRMMHLHSTDNLFLEEVIDILNLDLAITSCLTCKCLPG